MAYERKTKKEVAPKTALQPTPNFEKAMAEELLTAAKESEFYFASVCEGKVREDLPTAQEVVAGLHTVGVALHEQLVEMAQKPEDRDIIIDGTVKLFKGLSDGRLRMHSDEKDAYVIQTDITDSQRRIEKTVEEADQVIRRSAICYGLVSGLARAAAESLREENA